MRSVATWIADYWWLSWLIPTLLAGLVIVGAVLWFAVTSLAKGIWTLWRRLVRPEELEAQRREAAAQKQRRDEAIRRHLLEDDD